MIRFLQSARQYVCVAGLLAAVGLGGCAAPPPAAPTNLVVTLSGNGFLQDWNSQLILDKGESVASIYVVGDTLHIYTDENYDHALDRESGNLLYSNQITPPPETLVGAPVVAGSKEDKDNQKLVVFATSHSLEVYTASGRPVRSIDLNATVTSAPAVYESTVFVGTSAKGGRLDAVDIEHEFAPVPLWQILTNGLIRGVAAVQGETIFAGSEDGTVCAFYADRTPAWPVLDEDRFKTGGKIIGAVRADKEVRVGGKSGVYFSATDGQLYCVDPSSGKLKWKYYAGTPLDSGPEITDTTVFQYVRGTGLVAIDKTQPQSLNTQDNAVLDESPIHTPRWIAPHGVRLLSVDSKYAYVLSDARTILALDLQTGTQDFASRRTDLTAYSTNLTDSTIYASTKRGLVMSIHPATTPGETGVLVLNETPVGSPARGHVN